MHQYAITPGTIALPPGANVLPDALLTHPQTIALLTRCTLLARQGVAFLLLREKHLSAGPLVTLTRHIVHAIRADAPDSPTQVLVPGRADIALAAGAAGVHLSSVPGELTPHQVRTVYPAALVSVSCHTLDDLRRARDRQASLALFAPVFGKSIAGAEVVTPAGLDALRAACQAAHPLPVFALGGITPANAPLCLAAGAAGVAGIRMFFDSPASP